MGSGLLLPDKPRPGPLDQTAPETREAVLNMTDGIVRVRAATPGEAAVRVGAGGSTRGCCFSKLVHLNRCSHIGERARCVPGQSASG
ncbi:hypothetical protein OK074_4076 [Actinobacteria bacterium OK074]|nr:hypothetical protein OK074_4076 [Actinobacteria bacterium OK074]